MKLAIYLDELSNDPEEACQMAADFGIVNIVLRRVWATNISKATDAACKTILSSLKKHKLSVIGVFTDEGRIEAHNLEATQSLSRSITVATYFHARYVRFYLGTKSDKLAASVDQSVANWTNLIDSAVNASGLVPVYEIDPDSYLFEPADTTRFIKNSWRIVYDPAMLILRRNHNPFVKYFVLFKKRIDLIDLHDYKIGTGFVQIGDGDCQWPTTLHECESSSFNGWYILEPGIPKQLGLVSNRQTIVKQAIARFGELYQKVKQDATAKQRTTK